MERLSNKYRKMMKRYPYFVLRAFTGFILVISCFAAGEDKLQFISATPENTTLSDGNPLNFKDPESAWKWNPGEGNQGLFETPENPKKNAPPLIITIKKLEPGRDYEVFGFFWAHGFDTSANPKAKQPHHLPARFGLGLAYLDTFGGKHLPNMPWVICPESQTAKILGHPTVLEEKDPLIKDVPNWITSKDDLRLVRARLGVSRAEPDGTLPVYADDFPDSIHCGRTLIDGVGVRLAPAGATATVGIGSSQSLHFALRVGDKLSVTREIKAGADVNALDLDGLSTLFHPASLGDQATVKQLLAAGAKPNTPGQTIPVLTAAASTADAAMLRLLLEAGAEVPAGRIDPSPRLFKYLDSSHLHPAIAAARVGSLECLKILLEKRPDLNLETLGPLQNPSNPHVGYTGTAYYIVYEAVKKKHDELAAFLIDRGCSLKVDGKNRFSADLRVDDQGLLVAMCVSEGKAMAKTTEALLRRGVPFIYPIRIYTKGRVLPYLVHPWDGLSAAVRVGDLASVQQLLPQAAEMKGIYPYMLLSLAWWSGHPEILSMVRKQFAEADARLLWTKPKKEAKDTEGLRQLLPRVKQAAKRENDNSEWTVAVIPSADAEGHAALLEVTAANEKGWKVVDRNEIKAALSEARFANPWGNGEHRLAEFGDIIAADLLILVSSIKGKNTQLLRFEAVDVATGMPILREHQEVKALNAKTSIEPMLARIRIAFKNARQGERPKAITMMPFTVSEGVANASALASLFRTAIHAEVDASPGLISVGLTEIQSIANEQKLKGEGDLWAAAFTLEGGVAAKADGQITLTLRLRSMINTADAVIDVSEDGKLDEMVQLAVRAWQKLLKSNHLSAPNAEIAKPDARQTTAESERLLREGEWLINSGLSAEAIPLFERASLLNANPERLVELHLSALGRNIPFSPYGIDIINPDDLIMSHTLYAEYQRRICHGMNEIQALLDQAAFYQLRFDKESYKWKSDLFWHAVLELSYLRASIPSILPSEIEKEPILDFGEELDRFTTEYFRRRSGVNPPQMPTARGRVNNDVQIPAFMYQRNPELLKGWVSQFLISSAKWPNMAPYTFQYTLFGSDSDMNEDHFDWYGRKRFLVDAISKRMDEYKLTNLSFRKSELAYIVSTGDAHGSAARAYASEWSKLSRGDCRHMPKWVNHILPDRFGVASIFNDQTYSTMVHSEQMLAPLIHEPLGSLDWINHPNYRLRIGHLLVMEGFSIPEAEKFAKNHSTGYQRFAEIISSLPNKNEELQRLFGGVQLLEKIYGVPQSEEVSKHWQRVYQYNPNQVKSNDGKMTNDDVDGKGDLNARILIDLRQTDKSLSGIFTRPTKDSVNRGHMWMHYQPYEDKIHTEINNNYPRKMSIKRQPWLLKVDCKTGQILTSVNLGLAPGVDSNASAGSLIGYYPARGLLAQTNTQILTGVRWSGMESDSSKAKEVSILINKSDGRFISLDQPIVVAEAIDMVLGTAYSAGAVGIKDQFFCLRYTDNPKTLKMDPDDKPLEISSISSDGKVNHISIYGRRPELTPFDPIDRTPMMILRDGERLLVLKDKNYLGHYDPKANSWEVKEANAAKTFQKAKNLVTKDYQSFIFPHHKVDRPKGGYYVIKYKHTFPDMLAVEDSKGNESRFKVRLELPDGFAEQTDYNRHSSDPRVFLPYKEWINKDGYHVVVLDQTKDDLILGMVVGGGLGWHPGALHGSYLPIMWALPKDKFLNAIENMQSNPVEN